MNSAIVTEHFTNTKELEYINFVKCLGGNVHFSSDKWVCDTLCRAPSEKANMYTLYFDRIPSSHKGTVKFFAAISLIQGKSIATVKTYICDLIRFFDFWTIYGENGTLQLCDEFSAVRFYQYLEERGLAEVTNIGIWSSVSTFFKTMNGWDGKNLKNPFSVSPYCRQRKYGAKFIPESVAQQLDTVFKKDDIDLHLRCAYWILRLIPSRIGEVVGMTTDCLKHFDGKYILWMLPDSRVQYLLNRIFEKSWWNMASQNQSGWIPPVRPRIVDAIWIPFLPKKMGISKGYLRKTTS